jgi:hypothetical protein
VFVLSLQSFTFGTVEEKRFVELDILKIRENQNILRKWVDPGVDRLQVQRLKHQKQKKKKKEKRKGRVKYRKDCKEISWAFNFLCQFLFINLSWR